MGSLQNLSFHREIEHGVRERAEKEASQGSHSAVEDTVTFFCLMHFEMAPTATNVGYSNDSI